MTASPFVYFSKMFQAVPQLMEVQRHAGGVFVSSRKSPLDAVRRLYPEVEVARYSTWLPKYSPGYKAMQQARAIVTGAPTPNTLAQFEALTCMVFHGTYMFLSRDVLEKISHFDLLCTIGPRMRRTIARYQDQFAFRTVESGYLPFGSFPEKSAALTVGNLSRMGLDPDKKTVVYMPWGRPYGSWEIMAETIARDTPAEFNLILRPHPSQGVTSRRGDRENFKRISTLCRQRGNTLLDLNAYPLALLFSLADLMITDGTSPAEESLFYDVPQLFIETPLWSKDVVRSYARREAMHEDDLEQYLELYNCGELYSAGQKKPYAQAVQDALAKTDILGTKREEYFSWVFGQRDRQAGERVFHAVSALIG
jgi:hypothetical protein